MESNKRNDFFKPGEKPKDREEEVMKTDEELSEGFDEAWDKFKKDIRGGK